MDEEEVGEGEIERERERAGLWIVVRQKYQMEEEMAAPAESDGRNPSVRLRRPPECGLYRAVINCDRGKNSMIIVIVCDASTLAHNK